MNPFSWLLRWLDRRIERVARDAVQPIQISVSRLDNKVSIIAETAVSSSIDLDALTQNVLARERA